MSLILGNLIEAVGKKQLHKAVFWSPHVYHAKYIYHKTLAREKAEQLRALVTPTEDLEFGFPSHTQ